jgi:hypothetical protein
MIFLFVFFKSLKRNKKKLHTHSFVAFYNNNNNTYNTLTAYVFGYISGKQCFLYTFIISGKQRESFAAILANIVIYVSNEVNQRRKPLTRSLDVM